MTLIECFSDMPVDNISACLNLEPEKLIFLGDKSEMKKTVHRYEALLQQRGMATAIELWEADTGEMGSLIPSLRKLLLKEEHCVIDLTGGDEPVLMAVGAALNGLDKWQRRQVSVQKFDPELGRWKDLDGDGWVIPGQQVQFTVAEMIALHGGIVASHGFVPQPHHKTEELQELWHYICQDPRRWNDSIALLVNFESHADSKTQVFLYLPAIAEGIRNFDEKLPRMRSVIAKLQELGVAKDQSNENCIQYTYTSELMRKCANREGNVLEFLTLMHAREMTEEGKPFFYDLLPGVFIDWDGVNRNEGKEGNWEPEVQNEVDMVAVRNGVPLFVSCKNGDVKEEELYKLSTVVRRFGGPYAKKMLIATNIGKGGVGLEGFRQRAEELGIYLVPHAAKMTTEQWQEAFRNAMK